MKNIRDNLKVKIKFNWDCPKTYTLAHWENMKAFIHDLFKVDYATWLKVVKGCQQNPSCLGHEKDDDRTWLVRHILFELHV
jgi:hypothetical protein